jgi:hypothetical protein
MLGTISLDLFAVLLGGATALLPMFASDILHAGPWGLGLLAGSTGHRRAHHVDRSGQTPADQQCRRQDVHRCCGLRRATIVFALSTNIALSIAALLVVGASDTVSVVVRSSLVQLLTPDSMRGRVNAVNSLFIGTSNQLGEFESGMLAGVMGPVAAGVIGGSRHDRRGACSGRGCFPISARSRRCRAEPVPAHRAARFRDNRPVRP